MAAEQRLTGAAICRSDELADGGDGIRFELDRNGVLEPAFVVRFHGQPYAYLNRCAHVPVELDWQPGRFFDFSGLYLICATHGALYAPESGRCVGGRCDRKGLAPVAVTECNGHIFLVEEGG